MADSSPQESQQELPTETPEELRERLGERLWPLIRKVYWDLAGEFTVSKITGMLLEMSVPEIRHILKHHNSLKKKVKEAIEVLNAHARRCECEMCPVRMYLALECSSIRYNDNHVVDSGKPLSTTLESLG